MATDDVIASLREALRHSPENIPLRQHLAEQLLAAGRSEEAAEEFKAALAHKPEDVKLKIGLATAFYQQTKNSAAMVIVEDLVKQRDVPAAASLLYARLLLRAGDVERAVRQYKKAVESDPAVADIELASRLGIRAGGEDRDDAPQDVIDGKVRASFEGEGASPLGDGSVERPAISFKDVGGMENLKDEIRMKIIHPMTHAELYKAYGKPIGGGILMYGPPGCGKTHLARATAGEISAGFLAVGISDVLDMWIGNSEKNLHALFEQARRNRPCVL